MDGISESAPLASVGPATAARPADAPPFWPAFLLAFAATCISVGVMWDISWHETIGRDTFWTPAHLTVYLGGILGGCTGGWLAVKHTFLAGPEERGASIRVFGARAPLGAWMAIWGALAMITSAPFDNWWHNAYGLDVKILSPPHTLLALGILGIAFGALFLVLARQNRLGDGRGSGLVVYVGGLFLVQASIFIMECTFPNMQHAPLFYKVCVMAYPVRLVMWGRATRMSWPATRMALIYMFITCLMVWILPLFPGQPKLAPIYNPVTHMVPPPFPLLLVVPALAVDLVLQKWGGTTGWRRIRAAALLAGVFVVTLFLTQWFFSEFLLSPHAENWFFAGNRVWAYQDSIGKWNTEFWDTDWHPVRNLAVILAWAVGACWIGLMLGNWMRKVQR